MRHEAVLYDGAAGFTDVLLPFIRAGVRAGEPVFVVVRAQKIDRLRQGLGALADHVLFEDMAGVGRNPACIIPAWRQFVDAHAGNGVRLRGIGEPIDDLRSADELVECHRHEALLDVALADASGLTLVCPYDTSTLDPAVVAAARLTHPVVVHDGVEAANPRHVALEALAAFETPLPSPPDDCTVVPFDVGTSLGPLRRAVAEQAMAAGLGRDRTDDFLLAVTELVANGMQHGDGTGVLHTWRDGRTVVADVVNAGQVTDPLIGRHRPAADDVRGRGLWMVNQLCDLSQVRSGPAGTQVRVRLAAA